MWLIVSGGGWVPGGVSAQGEVKKLVAQLCPTLCDPMDCSLPGFSVRGDSPGKNTGWVAMPSSRESP